MKTEAGFSQIGLIEKSYIYIIGGLIFTIKTAFPAKTSSLKIIQLEVLVTNI